MASSASPTKRRQLGHKALPRRNTGAAKGNSNTKAIAQRSRLRVIGDTIGAIMRPTTALPAHSKGGRVSKKAVLREMCGWVTQ